MQYVDEPQEVLTVDDGAATPGALARVLGPAQASLAAPSAAHVLAPPRVRIAEAVDAAMNLNEGKVARAPRGSGAKAAALVKPTGALAVSTRCF